MSEFHRAGAERVNAFRVGGDYLFRHYFEEDEVFAEIGRYYNEYDYRFEVPASRFEYVRSFLADRGYALVVPDAVGEFVAAKRKYTEHPSVLFEESVLHRSAGNFNCFVMKDRGAVERAVEAGARRLAEVDAEFRL